MIPLDIREKRIEKIKNDIWAMMKNFATLLPEKWLLKPTKIKNGIVIIVNILRSSNAV